MMTDLEIQTKGMQVLSVNLGLVEAERFIADGIVQTGAMRPLARLGYMDYAVISPESLFTLNRPTASSDGRSATVLPGAWDGVYR